MNGRKWTWFLSLVIAFGMALAGVRSATASPGVDHLPETKLPDSAKFVMSGSLSSQGQSIPINGSGAFSGQDAMLDITLTAPEGTTSGPDEITASLIVLENKVYFKTAGLSSLGAGVDEQWYVADLGEVEMAGVPGSIVGVPGSITDLEEMLDAAISSEEIGKETINGAATTKHEISVDLEKVAAATGGSTEGLGDSSLSMTLWVGDADMYVHQFNMMLSVDSSSGDIAVSLDLDLTMTFSDFDKSVNIVAPANAEPVDLGLTPSIIGGMPGSTENPIMGGGTSAGMPRTGSSNDFLPLALLALGMGLVLSGGIARRVAYARQRI